jgi:hypothetical protein
LCDISQAHAAPLKQAGQLDISESNTPTSVIIGSWFQIYNTFVAVLLKSNDRFEDSTSSPKFELIMQTIMISQLRPKARYFVSWDWRKKFVKIIPIFARSAPQHG